MICVVDSLFLISMFLLPVVWITDRLRINVGPVRLLSVSWGLKPVLFVVVSIVLTVCIRAWNSSRGATVSGLLGRKIIKRLSLSMFVLYLCVGMLELSLIAVGFKIEMAPVVFELEGSSGQTEVSKGYADPELRWKFTKGEKYHGRMINSLGYRDREVDAEKKEGVIRVICMGDSVTAQGEPGYSQLLHEKLIASPPTSNTWESFNMAVYGYSSMQGLRVFQLETSKLEPDIVTLYFGWNDHWLEMKTDRDCMAKKTNPVYGKLYNLLKEKRFFMLLVKLMGRGAGSNRVRASYGFRVPPDEYTEVLTEYIKEIRAIGAVPLLITAARKNVIQNNSRTMSDGKKPDYNKIHDEYVELAKNTALGLDVDILDLHDLFSDSEHDGYFMNDGIHFKQHGLKRIALELDAKIRSIARERKIGSGALK